LALAANELVGGEPEEMLPFACAIELIHTYSLIHDDLPAMDDSELRRGKPTAHKAFGEPIAILAGDALLTLAFQVMTDGEFLNGRKPETVLEAIHVIAEAAGMQGMVGGQTVDMETQGGSFDLSLLEYIHTHKTGALILGAIKAGAILGGATEAELEALTQYGKTTGLAFQIVDDILDIEGSKKDLGKGTGLDSMQDKATYPRLLGLEESKKRAEALIGQAEQSLTQFGAKAETLKEIARYICQRIH
jgi:geranylgeranyl diphosphate synthase type II